MSSKEPRGLGGVIRSVSDWMEGSRLPRLRTSEIVGAVAVASLLFGLIVLRWLGV